jgi:NADPH:quinone reductase-like Zn-dependent oxidoreductase
MATNFSMGIRGPGRDARLEPIEAPVREPGEGEVLIRVSRAGVAFGDLFRVRGQSFGGSKGYPIVPGYDVAGRIERLGPGADGFGVGDRVTAFCATGGYARYLTIKASLAVPIPEGLGPEAAVALNLNYLTAWQSMRRVARLRRGDKALVLSAAGGVGSAMLDLARAEGIEAYGVASGRKLDFVRGFGARAIDYSSTDYVEAVLREVPSGVHAAFEALGPANAARTRPAVREGGSLVMFGFLASFSSGRIMRDMARLPGLLLFPRGRKVSMYGIDPFKRNDWYREDLPALLERAAKGELKPAIDSALPLERAQEAQERLARGEVRGKIVLDCD